MANYKLRCSLAGHQKDVRALYAPSFYAGSFVSGSRDMTAKVWKPIKDSVAFDMSRSLAGHTNFISSVCVTVPTANYPDGLIYTASNDRTILAFLPDLADPLYKLAGHENTVCALATGGFGTLLSGSWDMTAKVWSQDKCLMTLKGHTAAVWAVAVMPEHGYMLTGSADKSIKLWKAGKCERTITGHADCVRGLAVCSEMEFLSCSNDASIKKWLITTGECLMTYYGHTNYVYSISMIPGSKDFVTTGEDRTLRVWHGEECVQTVTHPAQSVWAVCCLPNGDIVTGASDSMVRVFSCTPERTADAAELQAFEDEVSNSAIPTQVGDIKLENLPGPEALQQPGNKDGQTKMVRVGAKAECHQWSASEGRWVKVGDVVGSSGGGESQGPTGKKMFEGEEYDYVFDVDIEEGMPPLKLPFNITDDPWMAAQQFIHQNELSQMFLDQIANFIYKNTEGVTLGQKSTGGGSDPFTGGSRFIPEDDAPAPLGGGSDPLTGGSRYVPDGMEANNPASNRGAGDPSASSKFFPKTTCLVFDTTNQNGVLAKIREFNNQVAADLKIDPENIEYLTSMMNAKGATPLQMELLDKLLQWPIDKQFPCLDILRLAIRSDILNEHFCDETNGQHFLQGMLRTVSPGSPTPNQMLGFRTFSNAFLGRWGRKLLLDNRDSVISAVLNAKDSANKNVQIAAATTLLNYSVVLQNSADVEAKSQCLLAAHTMIDSVKEMEAKFRLLVAIGNMIHSDENGKALAQSVDMTVTVQSLLSVRDPAKVSQCARQVLDALK